MESETQKDSGGPTTYVRVSRTVVAKLRAASKETGVPMRILCDRALAAYLESGSGT